MAHKTLVNGTAYVVAGGITLVEGTSYSVKNGKVLINGTGYEISFVLSPAVLDLWSSSDRCEINCVTYANGYWVVGGIRHVGGSNYAACIAYTTDLSGTWAIKEVWSGYAFIDLNCIAYSNGYWVVGGSHYNGNRYYGRISYATSLDGTWVQTDIWNTNSNCPIKCIAYGNGYWVVGGVCGDGSANRARYAHTTSLGGTWTTGYMFGSGSGYDSINCITFANGYWVAGGEFLSNDNIIETIAYATNPNGGWKLRTFWTSTSSVWKSKIECIVYDNGYWVVGGTYYNNNFSAVVVYATSLDGTWTTKTLWNGNGEQTINSIRYADGYWVVGGTHYNNSAYYIRTAYATSLDGTWTARDHWSGNSNNKIREISYADGYWAVGGTYYNNSAYYARIMYAGSPAELGDTE